MVQSELRTRLPEMQRQFHSAQSTLPENVRTSLQQLLASLENHMRNLGTHLHHLPDDGRHFAGEALNAGRPIAENAVDTLRQVASEFNEVSRSLFAAFEHEVRRAGMYRPDSSADGLYTAPAPQPTNGESSSSGQNGEQRPTGSTGNEQQASESSSKDGSNPTSAPSGPASQPLPYRPPGAYAPPIWPPPSHRPFFYPTPPPPHPPQWPFQWPPPPHQWFKPGRQAPQNPNPAPPSNPNLRNAHTQTAPHTSKSLFIGNVGFNVTERMIQDVFASKGFVVDVDLPVDATSGKHCGFGYLHFPSIHPAMAAMQSLQGTHIDGHAINLEFSDHSPVENFSTPPSPAGIPTPQSPNVSRRESVNKGRNTESAERRPSRSSISSEVPSARRARTGLPVRRKSVTFQEPSSSTSKSDQTAALLDSSTVDPAFAARFPSLIPQGNSQHPASTRPDNLSSLSPEMEMARFPPVSQLEARLLANQHQDKEAEKDESQSDDKGKRAVQPTIRKVPSHEAPEALGGSQSHHDTSIGNGHGLRRANTTISARSYLGPPIAPLRRRATERQSLRPNARPASEMDTWARLDRRERIRPTSIERIPGSFPEEETTPAPVPNPPVASGTEVSGETHDPIESCITTLVDLGYGTDQDGGRSRMAVYAAAADGDLLDAIEIIEEERKAYARRGSQ